MQEREGYRKVKKTVVILAVIFLVLGSAVHASEVLDIGTSVRSIGLGRSYTAMAGDATNIFGNPAGIGSATRPEIYSMYGNTGGGDVTYTMLGSVFKTGIGNMAVGYAGNFAGDLYISTIDATTGRPGTAEPFSYTNDQLMVGYGGKIDEKMSYGVRAKYVRKGSANIVGGQGTGLNADLGLLVKASEQLNLGLVATNVIRGSMGAIKWGNGYVEESDIGIDMGFEYKRQSLKFYGDLSSRSSTPMEIRIGAEWNAWKNLDLRAGLEQRSQSIDEKYYDYSAGVGYRIGDLKLDYAYYYNGLDSSMSQHFVSLSFYFPKSSAEKAKKIESYDKAITSSAIWSIRGDVPATVIGLKIGGHDADISNGTFKAEIPLEIGKNSLTVKELGRYGNVINTKKLRVLRMAGYDDVDSTTWAFKEISYMGTLGMMRWVSTQGKFGPTAGVRRAELMAVLAKLKGVRGGEVDETNVADVSDLNWTKPYIGYAIKNNWVKAQKGQMFNPMANITRGDAIAVINKFDGTSSQAGTVFEPKRVLTRAELCEILAKTKYVSEKIDELLDFEKGY